MKPNVQEDSWLLPVLRRIRKRPGMYLGDDRLNSLACYIQGILLGLETANIKDTKDERFLKSFGEWLGDRFESRNGDCWFYLLMCYPDRSGQVNDLYLLLDEYIRGSGLANGLDDESLELQR